MNKISLLNRLLSVVFILTMLSPFVVGEYHMYTDNQQARAFFSKLEAGAFYTKTHVSNGRTQCMRFLGYKPKGIDQLLLKTADGTYDVLWGGGGVVRSEGCAIKEIQNIQMMERLHASYVETNRRLKEEKALFVTLRLGDTFTLQPSESGPSYCYRFISMQESTRGTGDFWVTIEPLEKDGPYVQGGEYPLIGSHYAVRVGCSS